MRIGTRIAIMEGGRVVQIGTPQEIITNPADEYVSRFFDGIDTSRYLTAGDLMQIDVSSVAQTLNGSTDYTFVMDANRCIRGFVGRDANGNPVSQINHIECVQRDMTLDDVVNRVVASPAPLPVVDADGTYCGSINKTNVLQILTRHRSSSHV